MNNHIQINLFQKNTSQWVFFLSLSNSNIAIFSVCIKMALFILWTLASYSLLALILLWSHWYPIFLFEPYLFYCRIFDLWLSLSHFVNKSAINQWKSQKGKRTSEHQWDLTSIYVAFIRKTFIFIVQSKTIIVWY